MSGANVALCRRSHAPLYTLPGKIDIDTVRTAAKILGKAQRVLIVAAAERRTRQRKSRYFRACCKRPCLAIGEGEASWIAETRFSVTLPLGRELWGEADAVIAVGTRLLNPMTLWGMDKSLKLVRVDADPEEPARSASRK